MKDYYEILGVPKNASDEDIKKAFRQKAYEHHPDRPGGNAEKFKEMNEAYQVLSDKTKRAQYDQFGSSAFEYGAPGQGGAYGGFNWQDFTQGFGGGRQEVKFDFGGFDDLGDMFGDFLGFGNAPSLYHCTS